MATTNPFDLLGDVDTEDPAQLAVQQQKAQLKKAPAPAKAGPEPAKPAKLPSKPIPPTQAVREAKNESGRGGAQGGGRGYGRGRGGGGRSNRDSLTDENTVGNNHGFSGAYRPAEDGRDTGKPSDRRAGYGSPRTSRGGRRGGFGGFSNEGAEDVEYPRRIHERHSGTGRGNEIKRDGAGRGNWGTHTDDIAADTEEPAKETEKNFVTEKQSGEESPVDANKENTMNESEEKEPENKEMTLEEYEKVLEEKRKALLALKTEERKVNLDKDLESMQPLSNKKNNDEIFIKLGSEKDKRKEAAEKEERAKKSVSINEFLKPTDGERYYSPGGRGRGRGRGGSRGGFSGANTMNINSAAPSIEDPGQFPSLAAK